MKKIITSVILIFALLMSFASCDFLDILGGGDKTEEANIYTTLNEFTKLPYRKVTLSTVVKTGDTELTAQYVLKKTTVTYAIEQMSQLPTDGVLDNVPTTDKTVLSGTATIKDGKVIALDGAEVNLPQYDELKGAFNFEESFFKNVEETSTSFSADVVSPDKFLNTAKKIENLKIEVKYNTKAITLIVLTYNTANSTVTSTYMFET